MASRRRKSGAQAAARPPLAQIRAEINAVDAQLQELLNRRALLAQQVGISKHADGHTVDFYRPEREAQVLRAALERNAGPLRNEEIARLFREIMSACLAQQEPLKVAFLGPEGTHTQAAVFKHFGHSVRALALSTSEEVFHEVEAGNADFGVVAVENSTEGTITNTLDRFIGSPLHICGEVELRIHHCLMGRMESLQAIERICAHAQALAQCRSWLDEHLPGVERRRALKLIRAEIGPQARPIGSVAIIRPVGAAAIKRGRLSRIPGAVIEIIRKSLAAAERNPGVARRRRPDADLFGGDEVTLAGLRRQRRDRRGCNQCSYQN